MIPTGKALVAGVCGDPVSHSLSPVLMRHWIDAVGLDGLFAPFPITADDFRTAIIGLARSGCRGVNVTLPHKELALELADTASASARAVGAANILTFTDQGIHAANTDIDGFLHALAPQALPYENTSAIVFGAGGASRALVYALLTAGVTDLAVCNRDITRAEGLIGDLTPSARIIPWDARNDALEGFDLFINATSLGLNGQTDLLLDWHRVRPGGTVFDSVYTPLDTGFLRGGRQRGLTGIDGLDMLIGQARPSFEAFYGRPAPHLPDIRDRLIRHMGAV